MRIGPIFVLATLLAAPVQAQEKAPQQVSFLEPLWNCSWDGLFKHACCRCLLLLPEQQLKEQPIQAQEKAEPIQAQEVQICSLNAFATHDR